MSACTLPRAFGPSSGLLIGLALLLLAGACSSASVPEGTVVPFGAADPSTAAPSTAAASSPKEAVVPFVVCQSSDTWTRPSDEEQANEVWARSRYGAADVDQLGAQLYEDFFPYHGGNSELFDSWPLHGLWTVEDLSWGDPTCERGGPRLARGEVISLFLLLHEAKEVRLSGNTFYITVEKGAAGFQEIQFPNLLYPKQWSPEPSTKNGPVLDHNLVILDSSGKELARAKDGLGFQGAEASPVATATLTP